ncbi:MAG: hypothetical protein JW797_06485 [Bradymonadales bacterium]|nr:hypothetical protein [Bradymonadales bacterium]
MDVEEIRAFARRDHDLVENLKRRYWTHRHREVGPAGFFELGSWIYYHARQLNPEYPTEEQRREDLAHHVRLARLLEQVAARTGE